jgi:hypothetical protein
MEMKFEKLVHLLGIIIRKSAKHVHRPPPVGCDLMAAEIVYCRR